MTDDRLVAAPNCRFDSSGRLVETRAEGEGEMTGPRRTGRRWTFDEVEGLQEMLNAGKMAPEIGRKLNRTTQAIYGRLQRLYRKRTPGGDASRWAEGEAVNLFGNSLRLIFARSV